MSPTHSQMATAKSPADYAIVGDRVWSATQVPIVLLSRSDDYETKLRSIALGAIWA